MGKGAGNLISSLLLAAVLFFAFAAKAETTNGLSQAEIKGRDLARQLCDARPESNFNQTGTLKIRNEKENTNLLVKVATHVQDNGWENIYRASHWQFLGGNTNVCENNYETIYVSHCNDQPVKFERARSYAVVQSSSEVGPAAYGKPKSLSGDEILSPFAGSDFSIADLGLEFFHWPAQKVLPNTTRLKRGRAYTLLESSNPNPPTNGYSRVLSWIDVETGGILEAEAYDAQGKLLKVFEPKSFKKVNGQWELQEMEIRNVQTGSRTRLEFDLKK
jgi:hypothetical protein